MRVTREFAYFYESASESIANRDCTQKEIETFFHVRRVEYFPQNRGVYYRIYDTITLDYFVIL